MRLIPATIGIAHSHLFSKAVNPELALDLIAAVPQW